MKVVKTVRKYSPQPIDWSASSVESLVDLTKTKSEPPLTRNLTNRELELMVDDPLKILKYECISQFVKGVKTTTEAASTTTGVDRQDVLTLNKNQARKKVPIIQHKKDFNF